MSKSNKKQSVVVEQPAVERVRPPVDEKGRFKTVDLTMEEIQAQNFKTKSAQIRWLAAQGYSPMAISKFMNVIYQHVRNVLHQELKRPNNVVPPVAPTTNNNEESDGE